VKYFLLCICSSLADFENCPSLTDYNCYKLFGLDIMLDNNLKPWLLEVNSFPSMFPNKIDLQVNGPLVCEMFNILGFHSGTGQDETIKHYTRDRSKDEEEKEELFNINADKNCNLLQNITKRDMKILARNEDELSQLKHFTRLLPNLNFSNFYNCLDLNIYSDQLSLQWEKMKSKKVLSLEDLAGNKSYSKFSLSLF